MKTLTNLATRFVNTPLMIHPQKLEVILKTLAPRLGIAADLSAVESNIDANTQRLMAHYQEAGKDRSFAVMNGVAIIPVQGTLMKRCSGLDAWSGCCSYMELQDQFTEAMNDNGVSSLLMDIDSPGGEVSGCFELCDFIHSLRGKKPIYAVANDCAASAAYAIASCADKVFVSRSGAVGSVGVFALHADQVEFDKQIGVKYTYIFAGENKVDGNPHEPLSERAQKDIQTEVTREYGIFTETVARNRGVTAKEVVDTKARMLWADAATPLLADQVGTFDDAMDELISKNTGSLSSKGAARAANKGIPIMAEATTQITAPVDTKAEDEMKKGKADAPDDTENGKKKPDDNDGDEAKKAVAPVVDTAAAQPAPAALAAATGVLAAVRTEDEMVAITSLCKAGGVDLAAYLTKKDAVSNKLLTVAEISRDIAENRSAESERTALMHTNDATAGGKLTMDRIQVEAKAFSRANSRATTSNLYVPGERQGTTPEQAFATVLENNPEAYAEFRGRHNAQGLIKQLEAAGIRLQTA